MQWRRGRRQSTGDIMSKKGTDKFKPCATLREGKPWEATSSIQHLEQEPFTLQELTNHSSFKVTANKRIREGALCNTIWS